MTLARSRATAKHYGHRNCLMRAATALLGHVAICTEKLEALREPCLDQPFTNDAARANPSPTVRRPTPANFLTVSRSIVIYMINNQEPWLSFATANALAPIRCNDQSLVLRSLLSGPVPGSLKMPGQRLRSSAPAAHTLTTSPAGSSSPSPVLTRAYRPYQGRARTGAKGSYCKPVNIWGRSTIKLAAQDSNLDCPGPKPGGLPVTPAAMEPPAGVEPATLSLQGRRSGRLSYRGLLSGGPGGLVRARRSRAARRARPRACRGRAPASLLRVRGGT